MNQLFGGKTAVVYMSKYGASEKYGKVIAKKLSADLYDLHDINVVEKLREYSSIIWGGGIYAGKINGVDVLIKNIHALSDKHIIVFSVGNTPVDRIDILDKVRDKSIPCSIKARLHFYHFVAKANFSCLKLSDRMVLAVRRIMLLIKPVSIRSDGEKLFLSNYGKDLQVIDKKAIDQFVKSFSER